jgi:hypothetical protein
LADLKQGCSWFEIPLFCDGHHIGGRRPVPYSAVGVGVGVGV